MLIKVACSVKSVSPESGFESCGTQVPARQSDICVRSLMTNKFDTSFVRGHTKPFEYSPLTLLLCVVSYAFAFLLFSMADSCFDSLYEIAVLMSLVVYLAEGCPHTPYAVKSVCIKLASFFFLKSIAACSIKVHTRCSKMHECKLLYNLTHSHKCHSDLFAGGSSG